MAKIYAFSAGSAFFVVYDWVPNYFVSGDSFVCFFRHEIYLFHVVQNE